VTQAGDPFVKVKKGRWDGKERNGIKVWSSIPRANSIVDELIKLLSSKGLSLTIQDMVALSGATQLGLLVARTL
jgi:peroxidase